MKIYYLFNEQTKTECNSKGLDYSAAYFPALFGYLGVTAEKISQDDLSDLKVDDILFTTKMVENLPNCTKIVLGSTDSSVREQKIKGFVLTDEGLKLPIFVPFTPAVTDGEVIAYGENEQGEKVPAIVKKDNTFEFCFDLLAAIWFSEDGFVQGGSDYFFIERTPDTRPLPDDVSDSEPFNDILVTYIEKILQDKGVVSIYKLPPMGDDVPDFAMHISGDDDCASAEYNLNATFTVEGLGYPYHINAMPVGGDHFIFDKAVYDEIIAHGGEFGLHSDFTGELKYCEASQIAESEKYKEWYGEYPSTNVNHCLVQGGSTPDRLRWLANANIIADNGKLGTFDPNDINAFGLQGYGFGTAFPRFGCDDAQHGNQLLGCMEIPVTFYEPRLYSDEESPEKVINYLDNSAKHGRIAQYFIHPHYFHPDNALHRDAVLRLFKVTEKHVAEKGYKMLKTTTNRLADFWDKRRKATILYNGNTVEIKCDCDSVLQIPNAKEVKIDGNIAKAVEKTINGKKVLLIPVEKGSHLIEIA